MTGIRRSSRWSFTRETRNGTRRTTSATWPIQFPGWRATSLARRYVRLDLGLLSRDDLGNDRLSVLAYLTGGRSLSEMVPVLSKAAEWLRDGDAEDHSLFLAYQAG